MKEGKLKMLIMAALMTAFTTVATMIIKFPTPTMGYIHLGDGLVILCGILLGPKVGTAAAGIGSMLADLFSGYVAWMPATLIIKGITALIAAVLYQKIKKGAGVSRKNIIAAGIPAELFMVFGYFIYEIFLSALAGSSVAAAATASVVSVPLNMVQGAVGVLIATVLLPVLVKGKQEIRKENAAN